MAVNVKMGVDLGSFNSGIKQGQQILKGLNAEMKATDAEFKATGNSEQMLANKTKTLNSQIQVQKGIIDQAQKALKSMTDAGVDPADAAYQRLYATMMNATAGMNNAQAELNALGTSAQKTATDADKLTTSVNNIGKKISLEQVISGIDRITDGLETAAKKAVQLGETIWNSIMDSAKWADDTMTQAAMFGIDVETFQKMQKLVASGLDTTVESMLRSQQKFKKNIGEGKDEFMLAMKDLELVTEVYGGKTSEAMMQLVTEDELDLFFRAGQAIMNLGDEYEKEAVAQKLFGKSWRELVPLFTDYKSVEEYTAALDKQKVVEEELVENGADLYDQVGELKENLKTLKDDVLLSLAPALTDAATALNGLLTSLLEYLETPEGKQMLQDLGDSVSGLFDDLGKIDPKSVVENFTNVFNGLIDGLKWIIENKETLITALGAIVAGWAGLKLTGGVLSLVKMVDGLRELGIIGGGASAGAKAVSTGGAEAVAAGGNGTVTTEFKPNFWDNLASLTNGFNLNNAGAVSDWFAHEGPFGTVIQGVESWGEWLDRQKTEFQERVDSFAKDWEENELIKMWTRRDANQDAAERLPEGADWRPSYMKDQEPIPVETEPVAPADAAKDVSEQIGTVPITVQPVVNDLDWRPSYMRGYANGLPFVQNDGLYKLHKGEHVVPAREVQSRSYNSNLYVESMYMNNGTDAAGLASAMAAAQQRTMSGYGS